MECAELYDTWGCNFFYLVTGVGRGGKGVYWRLLRTTAQVEKRGGYRLRAVGGGRADGTELERRGVYQK